MLKKILISLCLLTIACSDSPVETEKIDTSVIMPLAVNNIWQYSIIYSNAGGSTDSIKHASIIITHDTTINSLSWYAAAVNQRSLFYKNQTDGLWLKEVTASPYLIYKFPADQGETYQAGTNTVRVIAQFQPVSVVAGDFTCYCYSAVENVTHADSIVYYVAPGYGLVQLVLFKWNIDSYRIAEQWLLDYARFH